MSQPWIWVTLDVAVAAHAEQIAEHGGGEGIREAGLLECAMARPRNLALNGNPDISELAASYAYGLRVTTHLSTEASALQRLSVKLFWC